MVYINSRPLLLLPNTNQVTIVNCQRKIAARIHFILLFVLEFFCVVAVLSVGLHVCLMAKEFCRDRVYPTKPIGHLPQEYRFADGTKSLVVDYATTDQLGQCRKMIEEAALRGDNVGVDEYEDDGEAIEMLLRISEIFHASDPTSGCIKAFMLIQSCLYQRSNDSCTASVYVFRTKDIDDKVYAELMSLVADFARDIDTGYVQCFTQVAICLHSIYMHLKRNGFMTVAVLPNWVNIAGDSLRDSAIMVKDFGLPERPIRSPEDVLRMLDSVFPPKLLFDKYTSVEIPKIPGLPKTCLLENGTRLVLRNATKDDDHLLYEMFSDAQEKGEGYSVHELPSLNNLRLKVLASGYTAVLEEERANKVIGVMVLQDSAMSRSGEGKVCDELTLISPDFRGKRLGSFLYSMTRFLEKVLGYERVLKETAVTSSLVFKLFRRDSQVSMCGALPRSSYLKGVGWVDLILAVQEVEDVEEMPNGHSQETEKCRL